MTTNPRTAAILARVNRLPASKRRLVLDMARCLRAARDAGDTRPAALIVAHLAQRRPSGRLQ